MFPKIIICRKSFFIMFKKLQNYKINQIFIHLLLAEHILVGQTVCLIFLLIPSSWFFLPRCHFSVLPLALLFLTKTHIIFGDYMNLHLIKIPLLIFLSKSSDYKYSPDSKNFLHFRSPRLVDGNPRQINSC